MWAIWVIYLMLAALNVGPKCKKSPNMVTLLANQTKRNQELKKKLTSKTSGNNKLRILFLQVFVVLLDSKITINFDT